MSSYVKRAMQPNEKVVFAAQLHWIIYKTGIFLTILGGVLGHFAVPVASFFVGDKWGALIDTPAKWVSVAMIALGTLHLLISFIRQMTTELVITDQRVIAKHGWIATTSYELMMTKVEGATIDQSVMGRMLGYGTLMVKGTGGGISPIDHVADPYKFHSYLMSSLRDAHETTGHHHD